MKKTLLSALMAAGLSSAACASEVRLVSVVTSPEPQTQLMAMVLTMQAVQQGAQARLLLCGSAGDLALLDAPDSATDPQPPRGMSPQGLMQQIIEAGAQDEVCAIYLPGRGAGAEALIKGIGIANPPEMAAAMLARDAVIWSF